MAAWGSHFKEQSPTLSTTPMYEKTLSQAGLSEKEAAVYEALLSTGKVGMGKLVAKLPFKRANTYNLVADLMAKGLVVEGLERGRKVFAVENPGKLLELIGQQEEQLAQAKGSLETILPTLKSAYALTLNKPGVRFYEGLEGIKQVLDDTLINNASKRIDTFSDVAGYAKYLREWNANSYAPRRKRLNIVERVIIPDNPGALKYMENYTGSDVTRVAFIDHKTWPFATEVNIYDGKVSFVTFSEQAHIGVIVDNRAIFDTLSSIFSFAWSMATAHLKDQQPAWLKDWGAATPTESSAG